MSEKWFWLAAGTLIVAAAWLLGVDEALKVSQVIKELAQ